MPQGFRNLYRRHRSLLQLFQHPPLGVIQDMGLILGLVMGLILVPHPRHLWVAPGSSGCPFRSEEAEGVIGWRFYRIFDPILSDFCVFAVFLRVEIST